MMAISLQSVASGARRMALVAAVAVLPLMPARAQFLNQLQNALGSSQPGAALGGLAGGLPAVNQASPFNIAGILQYCIQNNLVNGGTAAPVQTSLLSQLTGSGGGTSNPSYAAGAAGMLQTGQGQGYNMNGGLMADLKQKVCDLVLQQAKSLL